MRHANHYDYAQPVGRSVISFNCARFTIAGRRWFPITCKSIRPPTTHDYEDVFGNWSTRFEITQPYSKLSIVAESVVELLDIDPFAFALVDRRPTFPVNWMPWEVTMLAPVFGAGRIARNASAGNLRLRDELRRAE